MSGTTTLLSAVSSNQTGTPFNTTALQDELSLSVSVSGTVTAFSVQLQGSIDGTNYQNVGGSVLAPTAGTNVSTGVLYQYFQAVLAGYQGTGTVTCVLAYNLRAGAGGGGGGGSGTVTSVAATDASIVVSGTATVTPTIATGTLDVIATQHPPVASVPMNSQKFTGLANGSASTDSAAFGQLPSSGTPLALTQGGTGTSAGSANAAYNALSPMTTLGDIQYEGTGPAAARLAGNTTAVKNFLTQTGTGSVSAAPAWGALAASDLPASATTWLPSDNNLLGAVADPYTYRQGQTLVAGTVYLVKLPIRTAQTITYLWWSITTAGTGASSGTYTGLYNSSGTLLTGSADIGSSITPANTYKLTLTTPQAVTAGSFVWAAFMSNLLTTQPQPATTTAASTFLNAGLTAATYRVAVNSPAATTVASGSNGGEISQIASWSSPSAGVLSVASVTGYPTSGALAVAASGTTLAEITYTGISGSTFTGCAYVSGSASGTVATGGAVTNAALPASITPSSNVAAGAFGFWVGWS